MSTPKPSDLPHQALRRAKTNPLNQSLDEVEALMQHFLDDHYTTAEAIQLTDITLNNVQEVF